MKSVGNFLDKFKNRAVKEIYNREIISKIIKDLSNIDIDIKNINISNGVLKIKLSSIEKSEIFLKKHQILKEINKKIDNIKDLDIK